MLGGQQGIPVVEQLVSVGVLTMVLTLFTSGVIVMTGLRTHKKN